MTDQWAYIQVSRRKNKRPRNRGSPQPASDVVQDGAAANSRREPTVLGRSRISASKVVAAKPIRKKSIFCIDNLGTRTVDDITTYVTKELSIEVLSCFEARPRRRRQDREHVITRKAFRLCICEDDRTRLLDPTVWPDSIMISDWFFKSQSEADKRLRLDVNSAVAASSGSTSSTPTPLSCKSDLQQQQQQQRRYQAQLIKKTQPVMRQSWLRAWIT